MLKRIFDFLLSLTGLIVLFIPILIFWALATINTGQNGFFLQWRVGQHGKLFRIFKIRTMKGIDHNKIITPLGRFMRQYKIDEFPQLINVLIGNMSLVGPRPDLPGYYDFLVGEERKILCLKPGITGPASLKYANEEKLLALQPEPLKYNDEVIFPDKVRINLHYLEHKSFWLDIKILCYTFMSKKLKETYFK